MNDFSRINELKKVKMIFEFDSVSISDLYLKDENNKTYFEYIVENKISIYDDKLIEYITNNYELLRYATLNYYFLRNYYNVDLLFRGNPSLIELIFKENAYNLTHIMSLNIIYKLFELNNGEYLIQRLLDINSYDCKDIINRINDFDILYNCLSKINRIDLMKYANEKCLLTITPNGISMAQELINMNENINIVGELKNSNQLAEILYKNKKYNLMLDLDCE